MTTTSSNLVARASSRQFITDGTIHVPDPYLSDVVQHGDQRTIATRLTLSPSLIARMVKGEYRSPFRAVEVVLDQLKKNGNPRWLDPLFRLCQKFGVIAYELNENTPDGADLAAVVRGTANVIEESVKANADGVETSEECLAIVAHCDRAIAFIAAFRDKKLKKAQEVR